ncbi:MAG: PilN domain-containing protein [Acidobacteria bacterium]|nr:PilN domain-containing protein [Acidobacteriota bacterium]
MIYLKTSVGIELRGEDMLISSLQGYFSKGTFTHFRRIANYRNRVLEDLRMEVNQFFREAGLGRDNVILGIPRKDIVLRHLDLPSGVADNLRQVVYYQVQSFEPTEEDKFYFDYTLLNGSASAKKLSVQLVMVRQSTLDGYLQILRGIGIRPVAVLGSSMGLANLFLQDRKPEKDSTHILADLGPSSLELLALHHGGIAYSREVPRESDQSWKDLILREVDEALSKMRLAPEGTLEQIVLAGEASQSAYPEIKAEIQDCELLKNVIPGEISEQNRSHVQEAAASLGLAYSGMVRHPAIRINLLPAALRIRQTRWAYVPAAILSLAIVAFLIALGVHKIVQNRKLIHELDRQIQSLTVPVQKVQTLRKQSETMEKRSQSVEALLRSRDMNLEILRELTTILPPDTYLTTYSNRGGTIQIGGQSGSAYDLVSKLEKSPFLKDVVQKGSIFKDAASGKDRFSFEMKLEK